METNPPFLEWQVVLRPDVRCRNHLPSPGAYVLITRHFVSSLTFKICVKNPSKAYTLWETLDCRMNWIHSMFSHQKNILCLGLASSFVLFLTGLTRPHRSGRCEENETWCGLCLITSLSVLLYTKVGNKNCSCAGRGGASFQSQHRQADVYDVWPDLSTHWNCR